TAPYGAVHRFKKIRTRAQSYGFTPISWYSPERASPRGNAWIVSGRHQSRWVGGSTIGRIVVADASHAMADSTRKLTAVAHGRHSGGGATHQLQFRGPHTGSLLFRQVSSSLGKGLADVSSRAVCVFPLRVE
ncbi:MAG: hypothetical protein ACXWC0_27765, partial [Burkholderiales bacterium]